MNKSAQEAKEATKEVEATEELATTKSKPRSKKAVSKASSSAKKSSDKSGAPKKASPKEEQAEPIETSSLTTQEGLELNIAHFPSCRVEITAQIPESLSQKALKDAVKKINKEISLPGFRRGKAPEGYIAKKYPDHLAREWEQEISQSSFRRAIAATDISPLDREGNVQATWQGKEAGKESSILFTFEAFPQVPLIDYDQLSITPPPRQEVTPKELEEELATLAQRSSKLEPRPEGSIVEQGDWIDLVTTITSSGEPLYSGTRFECREGALPAELLQEVLGMVCAESKKVALMDPKSSSKEPVEVEIELKEILSKVEPKVDDAFALSLGLKDLKELKERLGKNLHEMKRRDFIANLFSVLQKVLVEEITFDLPASLLAEEQKSFEQQELFAWKKEHQEAGEPEGKELEELQARASRKAQESIRRLFLIHEIARREQITITQKELEEVMRPYLGQIAKEKDPERLRAQFQSLQAQCRIQLLSERVLERIARKRGLWEDEAA